MRIMSLPTVTVLIPVLDRPQNVARVVTSLRETCPEAQVLFLTSPGYPAEAEAINASGCAWIEVSPRRSGDYARKINIGVRETTTDLVFMGADDVRFGAGWFDVACSKLAPGVGVVGTNDLGSPRVMRGEHATHSLVTREYCERGLIDGSPGVLFEGYEHEFCDDELVGTAKARGAWAFAQDAIVEHLHPHWGKADSDAEYERQRERMKISRSLYQRRRHMWT